MFPVQPRLMATPNVDIQRQPVALVLLSRKHYGCISLGKILIRILNPKKRTFCFFGKIQKMIMNPMNLYAMKIQWINPKDSRLLCFFGKGFEKKVHVVSDVNTKTSN